MDYKTHKFNVVQFKNSIPFFGLGHRCTYVCVRDSFYNVIFSMILLNCRNCFFAFILQSTLHQLDDFRSKLGGFNGMKNRIVEKKNCKSWYTRMAYWKPINSRILSLTGRHKWHNQIKSNSTWIDWRHTICFRQIHLVYRQKFAIQGEVKCLFWLSACKHTSMYCSAMCAVCVRCHTRKLWNWRKVAAIKIRVFCARKTKTKVSREP